MRGWMVTTVVLGLVALGVALVALALSSLVSRARPLRRAARRLGWRAQEAQRLQVKATAVQETMADLQHRIDEAASRPPPVASIMSRGTSADRNVRP